MLKQKTLAQPIKTVGIGLHSGRKSTLTIKPAPIDFGIQFVIALSVVVTSVG